MFTTLSKKVHSYNRFFEYIDIDDESLKILHDLHIEEHYEKKRKHKFIKMPDDLHLEKYYSRMPGKWCINLDRQIAFLELEFVSAGIVRGNNNECFKEFLFFLHDAYGTVSVYYPEYVPDNILSSKIKFIATEGTSPISNGEILDLLKEAIKAYSIGWHIDFKVDHFLWQITKLKHTYTSLIHGEFSDKLKSIMSSVSEIGDLDLKFRKICLNHFLKQNINENHVESFYLYSDEKSMEIFDIIVWIYLHKYVSFNQLICDWEEIANAEIHFESLENIFSIGGDRQFFCKHYFEDRRSKKLISIYDDVINMDAEYSKKIYVKLSQPLNSIPDRQNYFP